MGFCCLDEDAELAVGDLNQQSLGEIWNSAKLEEIRRKFKRLDFSSLRCAGCGERLRYRSLAEMGERPPAAAEKTDRPGLRPFRLPARGAGVHQGTGGSVQAATMRVPKPTAARTARAIMAAMVPKSQTRKALPKVVL